MTIENVTIVPVVLCGGSGTRLWPLSRTLYPKQLLSLVNEQSLLQNTLLRLQGEVNHDEPIIICNHEYRFIIAEQAREVGIPKAKIILEPGGRNTAPAVTVVALELLKQNKNPLLLVMPADHVIENQTELNLAIQSGIELAKEGNLVTFGVVPSKPETGYGYIHQGEPLKQGFQVKAFVEKPSIEKAKQYVASGEYFWNSGMFLFSAATYLAAMRQYAPDIVEACQKAIATMHVDLDFYRLSEEFLNAKNESIDYAVMEKASNIAVVPLNAKWSDVGSWDVLWEIDQKDNAGNIIKGNIVADQVFNSYLRAENRLLAVIGLSNVAVIETADAVLVADRNNCQDIKTIVGLLKTKQCEQVDSHNRVYRPWGYYESLNKDDRYQVKHIMVKPGAKLSLQMHQHRSEHWVIIRGRATITRGTEKLELNENESVYIPNGVKHRIENNQTDSLHVIEVQTGSYLGEDDIVRFEDVYGRIETVA